MRPSPSARQPRAGRARPSYSQTTDSRPSGSSSTPNPVEVPQQTSASSCQLMDDVKATPPSNPLPLSPSSLTQHLHHPKVSTANSSALTPKSDLLRPTPSIAGPLSCAFDPRLKVLIQKGHFISIQAVLDSNQGKSIDFYLEDPFVLSADDQELDNERWTDGFFIFMYIWVTHHPVEALPLISYIHTIRQMAKNGPEMCWLRYDRYFRILKQQHPEIPWDVPNFQLYIQAMPPTPPNYSQYQ